MWLSRFFTGSHRQIVEDNFAMNAMTLLLLCRIWRSGLLCNIFLKLGLDDNADFDVCMWLSRFFTVFSLSGHAPQLVLAGHAPAMRVVPGNPYPSPPFLITDLHYKYTRGGNIRTIRYTCQMYLL